MTHHTRRHLTLWLLLLGVFCLTLPSLTADLNAACQNHAAGRFQIRAMTYTERYFYLVSSDGQLFVEDVDTFLVGIQLNPPTIQLSRPLLSLSTNWHDFSRPVDYADSRLQFGFTAGQSDGSPTLRLINYLCLHNDCQSVNLCVYAGFQMREREAPWRIEENRSCRRIKAAEKPLFWLTDVLTMYAVRLGEDGAKMVIPPENKELQSGVLQVKEWQKRVVDTDIGTVKETDVSPQSGLLTEETLFIANEDSTGHFLELLKLTGAAWLMTINRYRRTLATKLRKCPLSEVISLPFCQIETPEAEPALPFMKDDSALADLSKDSVKPTKAPPSRKMLYFALAGVVLIVLALVVYTRMNWWKKMKKPTRKHKNGDKANKAISCWSQIRGFLVKVFPCKSKRWVSAVQESRAISLASDLSSAMKRRRSKKRGKGGKKRDSKTGNFCGTIGSFLAKVSPCKAKKKRRTILVSKVRESILLASMASMANPSSKRRKKGRKVGPKRRASLAV